MVAMESTASYWKPLYNILESSDLNAMVVDARHMKVVPGRKTGNCFMADLQFEISLEADAFLAIDERVFEKAKQYICDFSKLIKGYWHHQPKSI